MASIDEVLTQAAPASIDDARSNWPSRSSYTASPTDWRDEVFYFLLPDRFSDGNESGRTLLTKDLSSAAGRAAIAGIRGSGWSWEQWLRSGQSRYQGGTLKGIESKLAYLQDLGVSTIWVGPVFRQRIEEDSYHGYGIQDFFDIDPRFGTRTDLVSLVDAAHRRGMRIVLDIIFNHSGCNWLYDATTGNQWEPAYRALGGYDPTQPRRNGHGNGSGFGRTDFVWPSDLQDRACYVGAGRGDLGKGDINDPQAEHKRTDFCSLRKFNLQMDRTLNVLKMVYQYWIALADIDGVRIDTLKHVTLDQARTFCNALKEYAETLGKDRFFIVGEVAGGNFAQDRYLDIGGRNLDACLDIGEQREVLCRVAQGLQSPADFFDGFDDWHPGMGSHRNWGSRHLSILNDHDHVFGSKLRLAVDAPNDHQAIAGMALQLLALGIPCVYYGTEQGLACAAEPSERPWISGWGSTDALLRETMFGAAHPRASGEQGVTGVDSQLPGFGPHGTTNHHVFNPDHPIYRRAAALAKARRSYRPLRRGRQYRRPTSFANVPFGYYGAGEMLAWSRIFDEQELVVAVNTNGVAPRGSRIVVDRLLSAPGTQMTVVCYTGDEAPDVAASDRITGRSVTVRSWGDQAFIELADILPGGGLAPSEVIVLANHEASLEKRPARPRVAAMQIAYGAEAVLTDA